MKIDVSKTPDGLPRVAWQETALSMNSSLIGLLLGSLVISSALVLWVVPKYESWGNTLMMIGVATLILAGFLLGQKPVQRATVAYDQSCWVEKRGGELFFCADFRNSEVELARTQSREMPLDNLTNFMLGTETEWLLSSAQQRNKTERSDQTVIFAVGDDGARILVSCNSMSKNDNADLHVALTREFIIYRERYA